MIFKYNNKLLVSIMVAFLLLVSVGCANQGVKTSEEKQEKDTIKMGFSIALTGHYAQAAQSQMETYNLWLQQVNDRGGIYIEEYGKKLPVEFIFYDDQSSSDIAVRIYDKLVTEDKVDVLLPPWGTTLHFAIVPIADKYQMPVVGNSAASAKLREFETDYFWFITSCLPDRNMKALVDLMDNNKDQVNTVAITLVQDLYPRENLGYLEQYLEESGFEVVLSKDYPFGVSDLSSLLLEVKELQPDAYIGLSYPADTFLVMDQAMQVGLNPKLMLLLVGPALPAFEDAYGPRAEGIVLMGYWNPHIGYEGAKEFNELYKEIYNKRPDYLDSVETYVSMQVVEQALEKAGTLDSQKIRDIIANSEFDTIAGPVGFTGSENLKMPSRWLQYQSDGIEIVWPLEDATSELLIPKPHWP